SGSSSHGFAAPPRYPRPFRGQGAEARCPRLVPRPRSRDPAPPSLRRVLAARVPRLHRSYGGLRLLPPRLTGLVCSPADTLAASAASLRLGPTPPGRPGGWGIGTSREPKGKTRENGRSLRFLGNPGGCSPGSGTPAGPIPQAITVDQHGPSARSDGGLAARSLISG